MTTQGIIDQWGIWCTLTGGITGRDREAWMKTNGAVMTFASEAEAEKEAKKHRDRTRNHPWASFNYTVRKFTYSPWRV